MKRNITSSSEQSGRWITVKNMKILVVYEPAEMVCESSGISPLKDSDGLYNSIALSEYESFLISALDIFDDHNFDVVQEHDSPYSKSYYAALVKKDQIEVD